MKRRQFAKNSTLALGSLMMLRCKTEATMKEAKAAGDKILASNGDHQLTDFGLQLWSVRDAMAKNPVTTLKAVSDIGYTDIESAGYDEGRFYGMDAKEFKTILGISKLKMRSSHCRTGFDAPDKKGTMTNNWEQALNDVKVAGGKSIVLGYIQEENRQSIDDYRRLADLLNKCGELATSYGLKLGYHNHDFEFFKFGEEVPYDLLLNSTDPEHVFFEMDHYWVKKGNADTFDYFKKYPGRFPVWHVKDMDDTADQFFTEVGSGIIDYVDIFKKEKEAGLQYFYVEQDAFRGIEPIASVEKSHDYLTQMKY
jgi:sugar phosphate isomerase/epimerase